MKLRVAFKCKVIVPETGILSSVDLLAAEFESVNLVGRIETKRAGRYARPLESISLRVRRAARTNSIRWWERFADPPDWALPTTVH